MKIQEIEMIPVRIPFKKLFRTSHSARTHQESVIVKVHTDERIVGIGNVDPSPGYSAESVSEIKKVLENHLIHVVVGRDPFTISMIVDSMDKAISGYYHSKALIEMALYDIVGKALNVPIYTLFGGPRIDKIPVIGWIKIGSVEENVEEAKDWVSQGFTTLKVKIGEGIQEDIDRVAAIRAALGDKIDIRIDANEAYSLEEAISLLRGLEKYRIAYCEQPIARSNLDGFYKIREVVDIPITSDEGILTPQDIINVVNKRATDFIRVKVMKNGGIYKTMSMINLAEAFGIRCIIGHGFSMTINALSEIHVATASKNIFYPSDIVGPLKMKDDVVTERLQIKDGCIAIPQKAGLGATIDDEKLNQYKIKI